MSSNSYCLIILLSCLPAKTACFCRIYIQVYNQKNEGIRSVIVTYLGLFMCTAYEMSVMHRAKNWLHVSLNAFGYCNKFTNLPFWEDKARIKETRQIFHTICQNLFFSFWHFFLYFLTFLNFCCQCCLIYTWNASKKTEFWDMQFKPLRWSQIEGVMFCLSNFCK